MIDRYINMIVVCIKDKPEKGGLTVGKHYKVLATCASYNDWDRDIVEDDQYVILNDYAINYPYCMSHFVSLEDFGNKQIENILT